MIDGDHVSTGKERGPDWVRETHNRIASGDITPVEMVSPSGINPMLIRHIRVEYNTVDGSVRKVELIGKRLGPATRFTARSSEMQRRIDPARLADDGVPQAVRDFVEKYRPIVLQRYLVTLKITTSASHDPADKQTEACLTSPLCTDATGAHHTLLIEAATDADARAQMLDTGLHITRIERVPTAEKSTT